jgi:hypothetical protein
MMGVDGKEGMTASSPDRLRSVQAFGPGLGDAIAKVGYLAGEILMVDDDEGTIWSIFHKMTRWYAPPSNLLQPMRHPHWMYIVLWVILFPSVHIFFHVYAM